MSEGKDNYPVEFDDAVLVMDVVQTLRQLRSASEETAMTNDHKTGLIENLRGLYAAQGIEISDDVLMDGIVALEENRFAYRPAKNSFGVKLARLYVHRNRWLPLLVLLSVVAGLLYAAFYLGQVRPAKIQAEREVMMWQSDLPEALHQARQRALSISANDEVQKPVNALYLAGKAALDSREETKTRQYINALEDMGQTLEQAYTIRIVSRPNAYSGVFRLHDENENVRNYYLIVEGIDAAGDIQSVRIESEEDQKTAFVTSWGVRVPPEVFKRVAEDKKDDQIIQNAVIGSKKRGFIEPDYAIETSGGLILDW